MLNRGVTTLRAMSAAMVTQAFGSLTNFVFNFYLMRTMVFEEFGLFGIGFAIVMVLNGFWQGFFTTQYIVLAPGEDHVRFPAQVYAAMMLTSAGAAALVVATAAVLQHFAGIGLFVLGIGFSAIAFSLKEFHIRCAFSAGRGSRAVRVNALMGFVLAAFLGFAWFFDVVFSADLAFVAYAMAVAMAAFVGHVLSGLPLSGHSRSDMAVTIRKLAGGGKWAFATNLIFSLRNNAHIIVLAGLLGPTAVARVNAARLFLTPPLLLLPALANVILPHFSQTLHVGGWAALRRSQKRSGGALFAVVLGYSVVLLLTWSFLEPILLGDLYQGLALLVAAWCAYASILMLRSVIDWGAQAERRFGLITKVSVGVTFVALAAAWLLTLALGPPGAVLALVLAELAMASALSVALAAGRN